MLPNSLKPTTLKILQHKDPELRDYLAPLNLPESVERQYLEFGEYISLEVVIDSNLNIVGGRVMPLSR